MSPLSNFVSSFFFPWRYPPPCNCTRVRPHKTQLHRWHFGRNRQQEHRTPSVNGHCIFSPARFQFLSLGDTIHEKIGAFRFLSDCFVYQTEVPLLNSQCLHFSDSRLHLCKHLPLSSSCTLGTILSMFFS